METFYHRDVYSQRRLVVEIFYHRDVWLLRFFVPKKFVYGNVLSQKRKIMDKLCD